MNEPRYAIRMTTSNGAFWWTGRMADKDNDGHGSFTTFGWSEKCEPSFTAKRCAAANEKAAHLESSLRRMFEIERIEVVPVQWSAVLGWRAAEEVGA